MFPRTNTSQAMPGQITMKFGTLVAGVLLFLTAGAQAQLPNVVNGGFEGAAFDDWFNRTSYCYLRGATGSNLPPNPQGTNWVEFGNGSWIYQQIGTWTEGLPLDVSLSVGSLAGKTFPGLWISLWVGGNPAAASDDAANNPTTLESSVGATQIALSELIQPAALTTGDAAVSEEQVHFSTGFGHTPGAPLWLLIQSAGPQRVAIGNVSVTIPSGDPTAGGPEPQMDAKDIYLDGTLTWTEINTTNPTFTLSIGTTEACDDVLVDENLGSAMAYAPPAGLLDYETIYYWRVDVTENSTTYPGTVWHFTTEPIGYPLTGISVIASSSDQDPNAPLRTTDGSGLDDNDTHGSNSADMWLSAEEPDGAWIRYDFNKVYQLHQLLVWNYNDEHEDILGYGVKDVLVQYSQDGVTWMDLGPEVLDQASGQLASAQTIDMAQVLAQSVRLVISSNHSAMALPQYGLSEVRFLYIPGRAREPQPSNSATGITADATLSWRSGRDAVLHEVYVGTDPNALTLQGTVSDPSFDTFSLDLALGQTVYWRVDELIAADAPALLTGDLWSYTIEAAQVVDDFESYTDNHEAGEAIWQAWMDGLEDPQKGGSQVGYGVAPFAEQTIVHGGRQSMPFTYDNTSATYSEVSRTFDDPQDWTRNGVHTLVLYFHGAAGNTGQLYLKIDDFEVSYNDLADALQKQQWVLWAIDLATLAGDVDLTSVASLTIGVRNSSGSGLFYVDDIALYPQPLVMIEPVVPSDNDPNLVTYYAFEGNANDSAGAYHATVVGDAQYTAGKVGQAINFNGFDEYAVYSFAQEEIWPACSVSLWVRTDFPTQEIWSGVFNNNSEGSDFQIDVDGSDPGFYRYNGTGGGSLFGPVMTEWTHLAFSCDGTQTKIYYDGLYVTTINTANTQFGQIAVGINRGMATMFDGEIDEVRVYNRALSDAEVAGLADLTDSIPAPF